MLNSDPSASFTSDAQVLSNIHDIVNMFRAGLPERHDWLSAILRIPAYAWTFDISREKLCVEEAVRINISLASTKFRAEFLSVRQITSDLSTAVTYKGWITFERSNSFGDQNLLAADDEHLSNRQCIQLDRFPAAIGAIIEGVRDRLTEPEPYRARLSAQLEIAREWKRDEQWGLQVLKSLLPLTPLHQQELNYEKATALAECALSKEYPITEDGDVYEVDSIRSSSKRSFSDGTQIQAIQFDVFMRDRHGNAYPSNYLYIHITSGCGKEREFLFESNWNREFIEFQKLVE